MSKNSVLSITIREMQKMLVEAYLKDPKQNLGFRGTPGIGKTEGIYGAADDLRKKFPDFFTKVVILSQMESVDFRMPWVDTHNRYHFLPNEDFRFDSDAKGILFLDEAPNAAPDVMKAFQQMLSDRRLGDIIIPDGVMIVIAGNNKADRAGVNSIPTAFSNRIEWHNVVSDHEVWLDWACGQGGVDVSLTSYIRKFPNVLNQFKAENDVNPTPRSWTKINKVLGSEFEINRIGGLVGEENASQFVAWRRMWDEFPEQSDIETKPDKAKVPSKPDAQFALACAMVAWVNKDNWSNFFKYIGRINLEYQMMYLKEAARQHPKAGFKDTPEYTAWIVQHQGKII